MIFYFTHTNSFIITVVVVRFMVKLECATVENVQFLIPSINHRSMGNGLYTQKFELTFQHDKDDDDDNNNNNNKMKSQNVQTCIIIN